MEFNEKLQELRKKKGLTQEELAQSLYVSRTAISKWESGRGYPSIESLKGIAKFFSVTVDELLSPNEVLSLAEKDGEEKERRFCNLIFGLMDICMALLLFLPFFTARTNDGAQPYSIWSLEGVQTYLRVLYFICITGGMVIGILTLALQSYGINFWNKIKAKISLVLSIIAIILFIVSLQPYAAVFTFVLLAIKALTLIKRW